MPYVALIGTVVNAGTQIGTKIAQSVTEERFNSQNEFSTAGEPITIEFPGAGQQQVVHRLGKVPVGWIIVGKNAAIDVFEYQAPDTDFLYLEATGAGTVKVLLA